MQNITIGLFIKNISAQLLTCLLVIALLAPLTAPLQAQWSVLKQSRSLLTSPETSGGNLAAPEPMTFSSIGEVTTSSSVLSFLARSQGLIKETFLGIAKSDFPALSVAFGSFFGAFASGASLKSTSPAAENSASGINNGVSTNAARTAPSSWSVTAPAAPPAAKTAFDFDGDRKADVGIWRPTDATWLIYKSITGELSWQPWGVSGDRIVPADYDGDNKTDYAVYTPSTGIWSVLQSSNQNSTATQWGNASDIPAPGDFDGDGKADFAVFRPSGGVWYIKKSSDQSWYATQFGASGDVPVAADYDGDGKADIAVFRPSAGDWYMLQSSTGGFYGFHWGISTDIPVPADYDGDGKADCAVWRTSTGEWFIYNSTNGSMGYTQFGSYSLYQDVAVPADYDGDNKADITVWRPGNGTWYIWRSSDSVVSAPQLGVAGDIPIPAAFSNQPASNPATPPAQPVVPVANLASKRLDPKNSTGGTDYYSRNFSWGTGLFGLPGRAGHDAGLSLSYNSLTWTRTPTASGDVMVFDADKTDVTPGFRFGFPVIEPVYTDQRTGKPTYLMVGSSGSRTELRQTTTGSIFYEAANSSYLQLEVTGSGMPQQQTLILRSTNGTQMKYVWKAGAYRCSEIKDRNGNVITINHDAAGILRTIKDTLNRTITVNYDNALDPTSITQPLANGSVFTYATFSYSTVTIGNHFDIAVSGTAPGAAVKVLNRVTFTDNGYFTFDYNSYGQVSKINRYGAGANLLNYISPKYSTSTTYSDCPRFSETYNKIEGFNNDLEFLVAKNYYTEGVSFTPPGGSQQIGTLVEVKRPDGNGNQDKLVSRTYSASSGWAEGLPVLTEDWADEGSGLVRKRWSWTNWTQDDTNAPYILNPRVTETKVGDATNTKRTKIDYRLQTGTNVSVYGLVNEIKVYKPDQTNVLKKIVFDYDPRSVYLDKYIIGLPSVQKLYDENDALMSKVTFNYDEGDFSGAGQNISPVQHDNLSYGSTYILGRGNRTSVTRWNVDFPDNASQAITSTVKYNTAGGIVSSTDPAGREVTLSYADSFEDVQGTNTYAYPTKVTDPSGKFSEVKYRFDIGVNVWAKSPDLNATTPGKVTTREYDSVGRLSKQKTVNHGGAYTRYEYPPNQTEVKVFTTVTDTNGNNTADAADEVVAERFLDGAGRTIKSRTPMTFDSSGNTVTWVGQKVEYDFLGRIKSQSTPTEVNGSWAAAGTDATRGWQWTSQEYDWKGRITREIGLDNVDRVYSYDGCGCAGGQVTTIQGEVVSRDDLPNSNARRTQKIYADILGREVKTEVLDWDGNIYTTNVNVFNGRDQITSSRQYQGGEGGSYQEAVMTYDGHGRLKTSHTPQQGDGKTTSYTYYPDDRVQSVTDGRGASSTYTYNNRGLVERVDYSLPGAASTFPTINPNTLESEQCMPEDPDYPICGGGPDPTPTPNPQPYLSWVTFAYDWVGNRTNMTDSETGTTTYEYDQLSRMTAEHKQFRSSWNIPTHNFDISYSYNLIGQLKSVTDPFGQTINYATDKAGKLEQITGTPYGATNQTVTNYINDIEYRAWGAAKQINYGNGVQMTQTFNNRLQLEEFKVEKPGETVPYLKKNYQYYNDGRVKFSDDGGQNTTRVPANFDRSYAYDFMGRLTAAKSGAEARNDPTIDRNQVPYQQNYVYNAFGNVTSRQTYHWTQSDNQTHSWTNNRESTWSYDEDGRLKQTPKNKYYYDAKGAVVMTTLDSNKRTINHLDSEGKPIRQDQYSYYNYQYNLQQTQYFIYSTVLGKLLTEVKSNGTKKRTFVYGMDGVVALQQYSGIYQEVRWEHTDPSNATYIQTAYNGVMYFDSPAELDPLGSNVRLTNPYSQQPEQVQAPGWGYGSWGDPFGGYSCRMDGFEMPCSTVMYALSIGSAVPVRNHNQPIHLGFWVDEDDLNPPPAAPGVLQGSSVITRFVSDPFLSFFTFNVIDNFSLEANFASIVDVKNALKYFLDYGNCRKMLNELLSNMPNLGENNVTFNNKVTSTNIETIFDSINSQETGGIDIKSTQEEAMNQYFKSGGKSWPGAGGGAAYYDYRGGGNGKFAHDTYIHVFSKSVTLLHPTKNNTKASSAEINKRKMQAGYDLLHRLVHELTHGSGDKFTYGHEEMDAAATKTDPTAKNYHDFIEKHCIPKEYR